jgi:hypothetical protein
MDHEYSVQQRKDVPTDYCSVGATGSSCRIQKPFLGVGRMGLRLVVSLASASSVHDFDDLISLPTFDG